MFLRTTCWHQMMILIIEFKGIRITHLIQLTVVYREHCYYYGKVNELWIMVVLVTNTQGRKPV